MAQHIASRPSMPNTRSAILGIVAGILIAVGSLLPWATISTGFGTMNMSGIGGYGVITLVAGIVVIAVAIVHVLGRTGPAFRWIGAAVAVAAGAVAAVTLVRTVSVALLGMGAPGVGLFVVIGGAVLAVIAALLARR